MSIFCVSGRSSRFAMEAQLRHPNHLSTYSQKNYGHHLHAQNDCVVVYGKPLDARNYISEYKTHQAKGPMPRDDLAIGTEACLWLPKNDELYEAKKPFINRKNTFSRLTHLKRTGKECFSLKFSYKKTGLFQDRSFQFV